MALKAPAHAPCRLPALWGSGRFKSTPSDIIRNRSAQPAPQKVSQHWLGAGCCRSPTRQAIRAGSSSETSGALSTASVVEQDQVTAGGNRYSVSLSKPLDHIITTIDGCHSGLILEESNSKKIFVAEVVPDGNADKLGVINAGDVLISTSGYVYTTSNEYNGNMVRGGEKLVKMNVNGETFNTVMAAIGSHPGHVKVQLEFERPAKMRSEPGAQ